MPTQADPKMPGIGVNLRVSFKLSQGGRKYMEDMHISKFTTSENGETQLGFFGVFDGHGGREAAQFARDNLFQEITEQDLFWSDSDEDVLKAIRTGFISTHTKMWKELEKWPRRSMSGYLSTAGTTCTVGIIRDKKLYIGHVGDSGIVLGYVDDDNTTGLRYKARRLTEDHKPETPSERARIESIGGSVASGKSGIQRVVWNRPAPAHKGPVRRSTQMVQIPFLAVARSLGDLWSYDYNSGQFAVSPEPDLHVLELDPKVHKCLVIGSDGLWNMLTPEESVGIVQDVEEETEYKFLNDPSITKYFWINHSRRLVNVALQKWAQHMVRADNTTAITILIDEYGPPKAQRLLAERKRRLSNATDKSDKDTEMITSDSSMTPSEEASGSRDDVDGQPRRLTTPILSQENVVAQKPFNLQRTSTLPLMSNRIEAETLDSAKKQEPKKSGSKESTCQEIRTLPPRSARKSPGTVLGGRQPTAAPLTSKERPVTRARLVKPGPDNQNRLPSQAKRAAKRDPRPTRQNPCRIIKRKAFETAMGVQRAAKRAKVH